LRERGGDGESQPARRSGNGGAPASDSEIHAP
jgi:hypothetical protein